MKKTIRGVIFIVVILLVFLFIAFPLVLNSFVDKERLRTMHNQNSFRSFVLNVGICLADSDYNSTIDNNWLIENCKNISRYNCEEIKYENASLTLKKCKVNGQIFSYENGEINLN